MLDFLNLFLVPLQTTGVNIKNGSVTWTDILVYVICWYVIYLATRRVWDDTVHSHMTRAMTNTLFILFTDINWSIHFMCWVVTISIPPMTTEYYTVFGAYNVYMLCLSLYFGFGWFIFMNYFMDALNLLIDYLLLRPEIKSLKTRNNILNAVSHIECDLELTTPELSAILDIDIYFTQGSPFRVIDISKDGQYIKITVNIKGEKSYMMFKSIDGYKLEFAFRKTDDRD